MRFPLAAAAAVREAFPQDKPVFVRISATDWVQGAWDVEQSVQFVKALEQIGIDFIDTSSGGSAANAQIPDDVNYQIDLAEQVRAQTGILTGAVGRITDPQQAEQILQSGKADGRHLDQFVDEQFRQPPDCNCTRRQCHWWRRHKPRTLGARCDARIGRQ